jgi:hypothetical protein
MGDSYTRHPRSRKRKQAGGFLVEASVATLGTSAAATLIKTFLAIAVRYGLHQIERKLKGPDANTWLHRVMHWIPNVMLSRMIMGQPGDESTAIIGISALMYVNNYLHKQRHKETVEGTKRLKMEQESIDAQEAKAQEDARNALIQEKPHAEKKPKPPKKEAKKQQSTKSKVVKKVTKRNATVQG